MLPLGLAPRYSGQAVRARAAARSHPVVSAWSVGSGHFDGEWPVQWSVRGEWTVVILMMSGQYSGQCVVSGQ